ncbi:hypothetical protein FXO26_08255 [Pseudomonas synxantha]|uniref:Uncharacterized protein n=1 Tax=Pseudomonas synxantha TaxID=47883 RepID=A0A5D3GEF1_9PSED|nr:hypothetical protein FXO26_08255 [Pseudomonas synxantha]
MFAPVFCAAQNNCGSGLAREGGVSFNHLLADAPYSRASPLPHFPYCLGLILSGDGAGAAHHPCGSAPVAAGARSSPA